MLEVGKRRTWYYNGLQVNA